MQNKILLTVLIFTLSFSGFAQHIGVNLTNDGIQNLLTSAIESYSKGQGKNAALAIPEGVIYERIKKEVFGSNPLINNMREYVNFEQNEDLIFYFKWSPINVATKIVPNSLKINVTGDQRFFQASIRFSLNQLSISGRSLELCELKKWKCDRNNALFGRFNNYSLKLKRNNKIDIAITADVKVQNGKVDLKLKNFISNLIPPSKASERSLYQQHGIATTKQPEFDITFGELIIPAPRLTINGQTVTLDVSGLRNVVLAHKEYLSTQLAQFAGAFLSDDLSKILNKEFFGKLNDLKTMISVLSYNNKPTRTTTNHRILIPQNTVAIDNTRVVMPRFQHLERVNLNNFNRVEVSFMDQLMGVIKEVVHQAQFDLEYKRTKTIKDSDLVVDFNTHLTLNQRKWPVGNKLGNGKTTMTYPQFELLNAKSYDVAVALSEPLINTTFKMATDTGLVHAVVDKFLSMPGTYITGLHMHIEEGAVKESTVFKPFDIYDEKTRRYKTITYKTKDAIVAVVEIKVNLLEQPTDGIWDWISNRIGAVLEKGVIWFPLEIKFYPQITKVGNKFFLELEAVSPFLYKGLRNSYNYPYKDMKGVVHNALLEKLKTDLKPLLEDLPKVDLTPYVNLPGVELEPVQIYAKKSGHLIIATKVKKLDLKELSEMKGK
jgi:hypothetical protein